MKRLKIILLTLSFLVVIVAYVIAPPNAQLGTYAATLSFPNPTNYSKIEEVVFNFNLSDRESVGWKLYVFSFDEFDVTVYAKENYALTSGFVIEFKVKLVWHNNTAIKIASSLLVIKIENRKGFSVVIRPIKIEDDTYVFRYRPLVKSREAFTILFLIAFLWFTETVPLSSSALLIPILAVIFNILSPKTALAPFFHPVVALIIGGLLIGRALQKHQIDKRIALLVLSRTGSGSPVLILVIMYTTAFLSFWISNTASAAIMLPIGLAVLGKVGKKGLKSNYGRAMILGIVYSATIGGIGTLIGTTPNPIAAGMLQELLGIKFYFTDWIPFGMPYVFIFIPVAWKILVMVYKPEKELEAELSMIAEHSREELKKLGPMTFQQKAVVAVFIGTVVLWFTEKMPEFVVKVTGFSGHGISSGIVALIGAVSLYFLGLLDEGDMKEISWSAILIIGGGICLGEVLMSTGVSEWIAFQLTSLKGMPVILLNFLVGALSLIITMFASNTAAASILVPIAIPLAISLGVDPILLTITIAIAASLDFALPVGTPPSTLAYSTGLVKLKEMLKAGLILDLVSLLLLTLGIVWIWALLGLVTI
ncbi:MAG: SLC13 family permease [Candidatus Baldrarchaeia archaeon]